MDVENIDGLSPAELDALLERALDPHVPVELLYAVLERIGAAEQGRAGATSLPQRQVGPPQQMQKNAGPSAHPGAAAQPQTQKSPGSQAVRSAAPQAHNNAVTPVQGNAAPPQEQQWQLAPMSRAPQAPAKRGTDSADTAEQAAVTQSPAAPLDDTTAVLRVQPPRGAIDRVMRASQPAPSAAAPGQVFHGTPARPAEEEDA